MTVLSTEEQAIIDIVGEFVDREVRTVVRELEHADTYPEMLIEQMKELGIYGLAIPEPWGEAPVSMPCYALVTAELARGWMSLAGAMGGHTVVAKLLVGIEMLGGAACVSQGQRGQTHVAGEHELDGLRRRHGSIRGGYRRLQRRMRVRSQSERQTQSQRNQTCHRVLLEPGFYLATLLPRPHVARRTGPSATAPALLYRGHPCPRLGRSS